jgi:hypothetical protein
VLGSCGGLQERSACRVPARTTCRRLFERHHPHTSPVVAFEEASTCTCARVASLQCQVRRGPSPGSRRIASRQLASACWVCANEPETR